MPLMIVKLTMELYARDLDLQASSQQNYHLVYNELLDWSFILPDLSEQRWTAIDGVAYEIWYIIYQGYPFQSDFAVHKIANKS